MAEGNWIKIYRKMVDDPIFVNSTGPQVKVLLTVMFLAAWTPKKWDVLGREFTIQPGEVFISAYELARRAGDDVSRDVVRKALVRFEKMGFWTLKRTHRGVLIHIVNWRKYQLYDGEQTPKEPLSRPQADPMEPLSRPQADPTNKKESKKVRKKESKNIYIGLAPLFDEFAAGNEKLGSALLAWAEMRKSIRKPLTEYAARLNLKKLKELGKGDMGLMTQIVERSVMLGYQGFYPLKSEKTSKPRPGNGPDEMKEFYDAVRKS